MEEQNSSETQPTVKPSKDKKTFNKVWYFLLTLILMAAAGFGVYYYMNNQQEKAEQANLKSITDLQNNVKTLNQKLSNQTSQTSTTTSSDSKNEFDTLKIFCKGTETDNILGPVTYVENTNGKYGLCVVGKPQSEGAMLVAAYQNGKWVRVWAGNGIMEQSLCTKYKIPTSIYADCSGNY